MNLRCPIGSVSLLYLLALGPIGGVLVLVGLGAATRSRLLLSLALCCILCGLLTPSLADLVGFLVVVLLVSLCNTVFEERTGRHKGLELCIVMEVAFRTSQACKLLHENPEQARVRLLVFEEGFDFGSAGNVVLG